MKLEQQTRAELIGILTQMESRMLAQMPTEELLSQAEAIMQKFKDWTSRK